MNLFQAEKVDYTTTFYRNDCTGIADPCQLASSVVFWDLFFAKYGLSDRIISTYHDKNRAGDVFVRADAPSFNRRDQQMVI